MSYDRAKIQAKKAVMDYEKQIARLKVQLELEKEKHQKTKELVGMSDNETVAILQAQLKQSQDDNRAVLEQNIELQAKLAVR